MNRTQLRWTASAVALLALLALLALPAFAADEMTVDQIIAKNIEARGGEDAWKKVESSKMSATMSMPAMGLEAPMVIEFKRPKMVRVEATMQGMTMVQAYDGTTGWAIMPFMGNPNPEEMAEDQLKQLLDQADFEGPLMDYKDKGNTVELIGVEDFEGTEAYKLKISKKNGDIIHTYIDSEYFLEIRQESKQMMQGTEVEAATTFGDFKEVAGMMMPHSMEVSMGGGPTMQTITIDSVEVGVDIADDRFTMPEVKAEEEAAE